MGRRCRRRRSHHRCRRRPRLDLAVAARSRSYRRPATRPCRPRRTPLARRIRQTAATTSCRCHTASAQCHGSLRRRAAGCTGCLLRLRSPVSSPWQGCRRQAKRTRPATAHRVRAAALPASTCAARSLASSRRRRHRRKAARLRWSVAADSFVVSPSRHSVIEVRRSGAQPAIVGASRHRWFGVHRCGAGCVRAMATGTGLPAPPSWATLAAAASAAVGCAHGSMQMRAVDGFLPHMSRCLCLRAISLPSSAAR